MQGSLLLGENALQGSLLLVKNALQGSLHRKKFSFNLSRRYKKLSTGKFTFSLKNALQGSLLLKNALQGSLRSKSILQKVCIKSVSYLYSSLQKSSISRKKNTLEGSLP